MLHRLSEFRKFVYCFAVPLILAGCSMGDPVASVAITPPDPDSGDNRAPTISGNPPAMARVGGSYSFTPTASDPDADLLSFRALNMPGWVSFDTTSGTLSGFPFLGTEGTYNDIMIIVSDGTLSQSLGPFSITVEPQSTPNMPPEIDGVPPATVTVGNAYSFAPAASDPDGDVLIFDSSNAPAWAVFDPANGQLSGTPQPGDEGAHENISISVTDGMETSSLPSFSITVTAQTSAPVISGTPSADAVVGDLYEFIPTASDPDGDALVFAIENRPGWASFSAATGRLRGTPAAADVGNYPNIVITVTDGQDTAVLPVFSIAVAEAANAVPIISGEPATATMAGLQYEFQPTATDPDGDNLVFIVQNAPGWASFDSSTGRLAGTPQVGDIGTYGNIRITVSDGRDSASLPAFTLNVTAGNNAAPQISGSPPASVTVGQPYNFQPIASDPDGDTLTFTVQNMPSWASLDASSGRLTGVPQSADAGNYLNVILSVSDGQSTVALPAFSIVVNQINLGSITLSWTPPTRNTDGTTLNDLAGYVLYSGLSADSLSRLATISNPGLSTYTVDNLAPNTYYFAITATNSSGVESDDSNVATVMIE